MLSNEYPLLVYLTGEWSFMKITEILLLKTSCKSIKMKYHLEKLRRKILRKLTPSGISATQKSLYIYAIHYLFRTYFNHLLRAVPVRSTLLRNIMPYHLLKHPKTQAVWRSVAF